MASTQGRHQPQHAVTPVLIRGRERNDTDTDLQGLQLLLRACSEQSRRSIAVGNIPLAFQDCWWNGSRRKGGESQRGHGCRRSGGRRWSTAGWLGSQRISSFTGNRDVYEDSYSVVTSEERGSMAPWLHGAAGVSVPGDMAF